MKKQRRSPKIWALPDTLDAVVIPTALSVTRDGRAVMGRGLSKQAADRFPDLTIDYGAVVAALKSKTSLTVLRYGRPSLLLFPVKPWREDAPHLGWRRPSSLQLIEKGLKKLASQHLTLWPHGRIFIPDVGCSGVVALREPYALEPERVDIETVRGLIQKYCGHIDRIVHVSHWKTI